MTYVPMPPSARATPANQSSTLTCAWSCASIRSTVMPALTSPVTLPCALPSARTGVTTRADGPSVPVYVSAYVLPCSASAVWPR